MSREPLNPFALAGTAGMGVIMLAGAYQLATAPRPTSDAALFNVGMAILLAASGIVALVMFIKTLRGSNP